MNGLWLNLDASEQKPNTMKPGLLTKLIIAAATTAFLTGCVTHRTVTRGGKTVESGYVMKTPFSQPTANPQ